MDVTLQQKKERYLREMVGRVSILVLMDVTLQLFFDNILLKQFGSFNPCFNGCHSSTIIIP